MNEPPVQSRTSGIENLNARTDDENNAADKEEESQNTPSTKKPSMETKLKRWWAGVGLDPITALMMMKGGLPPTIIFAMYQADSVAKILGTLGYLSAIVSIIALAILPRAKFISNMIINIISVCAAAACALLTIYCATQARKHTTPKSHSTAKPPAGAATSPAPIPYNSSASAVAAVWLFFWIFVANVIRVKLPQAQFGVILFSISITVACCNAPLFPNMIYGKTFAKLLLQSQLIGLGVATGVSLFIIPVSCRTIILKQITRYLGGLQECFEAYKTLLQSLENQDAMSDLLIIGRKPRPEAAAVTGATNALTALHGQIQTDLPFAKREIAYGKLSPDDLKDLNRLMRFVLLPTVGLSSVVDILQQLAAYRGWTEERIKNENEEEKTERDRLIQEWSSNMKLVRKPFGEIIDVMKEAIEHVLLQLQFKSRPKTAKSGKDTDAARAEIEKDVESAAQATAPGDPGFASYLARKSNEFYQGKQLTLVEWARKRGISLPDDFFSHPDTSTLAISEEFKNEEDSKHQQNQRQLFLLLYMESLLYSSSQSLLNLVVFADKIAESGKMSKNRLIFPGYKRLRKFITSMVEKNDLSNDSATFRDVNEGTHQVYMGASYNKRKNPEHLAPENTAQKLGDVLRAIPDFFRSSSSNFGLRAAFATISLAIPMFLERTQQFSNTWRLFWAVIMTAISMTPTSGQSLFGFLLRTLGSFLATIAAWLIYYIPGNGKGNVAGIVVLYWAFSSLGYYFPMKRPQLASAAVITIITITLIIGYELEEKKIGAARLATTGQTYLPIYEFGPVRLASVVAGLFVAFVWTIFPYPISEHSIIRGDLGGALYLLANYYSVVHETVATKFRQDEGDMTDKNSPGRQLQRARLRIYNKQLLLLDSLKQYSAFAHWEIPIGGKFPHKQYDTIIASIEHIVNYMSLISFASQGYGFENDTTSQWPQDFRRLMGTINPTSHATTMVLSLLSASIREAQPLPPYLPLPQPYGLSARLEELDRDILSLRHMNEPGYAAFAVLQLSSRCIFLDMENLVNMVKELVGELDFSFHVVKEAGRRPSSNESGIDGVERMKPKGD